MALSQQMSRTSDAPRARRGVSLGWALVFFATLQLGSFLKSVTPNDGSAAPFVASGAVSPAGTGFVQRPRVELRAAVEITWTAGNGTATIGESP